ncbi:MAG: succinate dehydrogenase cytochrome b subunit [Bdellovibrionota bacterium]
MEAVASVQNHWLLRTWKSSIGAKAVMAVTGLALFGFVVMHMLGNLQVFLGQEHINRYGHFLKNAPEILWPARLGLLAFVGLHILSAFRLSLENQAARPVQYAHQATIQASVASRYMLLSGMVLLAFIAYHLAHFTLGMTHPEHFHLVDAQGRHDIYSMVILGFQNVWVSGFYILAMLCLGMHLSHGVSSLFQSLGLNSAKYRPTLQLGSRAFAALIVIGNCSMPIAVLTGCLKLPAGVTP